MKNSFNSISFLPAVLLVWLLALTPVHPQSTSWTNSGTGSWFDSANWNNGVPNSGVDAYINATGAIIPGSSGTARAGFLYVGEGTTASLTIESGGYLKTGQGRLAWSGSSSQGTALVDGGTWEAGSFLEVGFFGHGILNVQNGGLVIVGNETNLAFGALAQGEVTLKSGGTLQTGHVNNDGGAGGVSLLVDGGVLRAGTDEANFLRGFDPGQVVFGSNNAYIDTNGYNIGISTSIGGTGGLIKTGSGTLTLTGSNTFAGSFTLGTVVREGTLSIRAGGSLSQPGGIALVAASAGKAGTLEIGAGSSMVSWAASIGVAADATGVVNVTGTGASWQVDQVLHVGTTQSALGTLNVTSGGVVTVNERLDVGANPSSSGMITVSGSGSSVEAKTFIVGDDGTGVLNLEDAGSVTVNGGGGTMTLGGAAASQGTLNIGTGAAGGQVQASAVTSGSGGATVNFNHTGSLSFAPRLLGTQAVNKLASGTTVLSGTNSYTGGTTISGGALQVAQDANLGSASGSLTFDGGALRTTATFSMNRATTLRAGGGVFEVTAGTLTQQGLVSGTGSLTKAGGGALVLSNANTYSGGTQLTSGTLVIGNDQALGSGTLTMADDTTLGRSGALTVGNDVVLQGNVTFLGTGNAGDVMDLNGSVVLGSGTRRLTTVNEATTRFFGGISGSGGVTIAGGSGEIVFRGDNSYAGLTTVEQGGVLRLDTLGGTAIAGDLLVQAGGQVWDVNEEKIADTAKVTVDGYLAMTVGTETIGSLFGSGTVDVRSFAGPFPTLRVNSGSFAGQLVTSGPAASVAGFQKVSSGTLTLSGSNSFGGSISVKEGTLSVNGITSGTGPFTVESGATLSGSGTLAGVVTVKDGGVLAPGNSPGTITLGGLILNSTSKLAFELGTVSDLIAVQNDLTLDGILDITAGPGFGVGVYTLFTYGGTLDNQGLTLGAVPAGFLAALDFSTAGAVKLTVVPPDLFWDGTNISPNGQVNGGSGVWDNSSTNWTTSTGSANFPWTNSGTAIFSGTVGIVAVTETIDVGAMDFQTNGYIVTGTSSLAVSGSALTVHTGSGVTALVTTSITGTGGLITSGTGGVLVLTGSSNFTGTSAIKSGTLVVSGAGAVLDGPARILVGAAAGDDGALVIENGGQMNSGLVRIADQAGSAGNALVSGGTWVNQGMEIGNYGTGTLLITDGLVSANNGAVLGFNSGAVGVVTVTGGTFAVGGNLDVGFIGTGTVTMDGGLVTAQNMTLGVASSGGRGYATVTSGTLDISGLLNIGPGVSGELLINGGLVNSGTGSVGVNSGDFGTVTVTSGTWANATRLLLGSSGTGVMTLAGDGVVSVGSGTLQMAQTSAGNATLNIGSGTTAAGTLLANVVTGSAGTSVVNFHHTGTTIFAPRIEGKVAVNQLAGTTILTAENSHTDGTQISGGTLQLGNGGTTGSIAGNVANSGTLAFARSDALTFGGTISGSGVVRQIGTGTVTLGALNSYSGGTDIVNGVLQISGTSALGTGDVEIGTSELRAIDNATVGGMSLISVNNGATGTFSATAGKTLTLAPLDFLLTGTATLAIGTAGNTGTVFFAPTGAVALTAGAQVRVNFGTLRAGSDDLSFITDIAATTTVASGATLDFNDFVADGGIANLQGAGIVQTGTLAATNLEISAGDFAGSLTGAGAVQKVSSGTLTLTGSSSYTGGTEAGEGTLLVGHNKALGTGEVALADGVTFGTVSGSTILLGNGFSVAGDVSLSTAAPLVLTGTVDLGNATRTLTFVDQPGQLGVSGPISGAGGLYLAVSGSNTALVSFSGSSSNTYEGLTTVDNGVTLSLEKSAGATALAGNVQVNLGGALAIVDSSEQIASTATLTNNGLVTLSALSGTLTQTLGALLGAGTIRNVDGPSILMVQSGSFGGLITDAPADVLALVKSGTGALVLTGGNAYRGGTTISGGTLETRNTAALGTGELNLNAGSLAPVGELEVTSLTWTGGTITGTIGTTGSFVDISGNLILTGDGEFVFTGGLGFAPNTTYAILSAANLAGFGQADFSGNTLLGLAPKFTIEGDTLYVNFEGATSGPLLQNSGPVYTPTYADFLVDGRVRTGGPGDNNVVNSLIFAPNGRLRVFNDLQVTSGNFTVRRGSANIDGGRVIVPGDFNLIGRGTLIAGSEFAIGGDANINGGNLVIDGPFNAGGNMNVHSSLTVNGKAQIGGNLNADDSEVTVNGIFGMGGAASLNNGTELLVNQGGVMNVAQTMSIHAGATARINGLLTSPQVNNSGLLKGTGVIAGNVWNNGIVAPGNSPGILSINGNYTQTGNGALEIEPGDLLWVSGHATLAGTLRLVAAGKLKYGQQITFLQAGSISGEFDEIVVPNPSKNRGRLLIQGGSGTLLIAPTSYTLVAKTGNQRNVARALDSFIPAKDNDREVVSIALDLQSAEQYPSAFEQISPAFYESLADISIEQINGQNQNLAQRASALRLGARGFQSMGIESPLVHDKDGKSVMDAKDGKGCLFPAPGNKWGVWVQGSGNFARVTSASQVPNYNFQSGGFLAGADYRWSENFVTGLYGGYQGTYAKYNDGGRTTINSVQFGGYASYDNGGFYSDAIVGGGYSAYAVRRPIKFSTIDRTARSRPDGGQFTTYLDLGYDWKLGNFTLGPIASGQYTYAGIAPFTETGADSLDLSVGRQNANSLRTSLGGRIAYTWKVSEKFTLIPEGRMFWQHEFLENPRNIGASLDGGNGDSFGYTTSTPDRDAVFTSVGLIGQFGENWNAYFYYNADFGRQDFISHAISTGLNFKF